jgi:transglutaminase-like putative cysteine protease
MFSSISATGNDSMAGRLSKINPGMAVGLLLGCLFFYLMAVRLGVFQDDVPRIAIEASGADSRDTWMRIEQNGRKIGYAHRQRHRDPEGYVLSDRTTMRINTMGMVQDLAIATRARLNADMSLREFDFSLQSSLFSFNASGRVANGRMAVEMDGRKMDLPLDQPLYLTAGILDAVEAAGMAPGASRTFPVFDPATLGKRPVRVTLVGREILDVSGKQIPTRKFEVDFMGSAQTAWIDDSGNVVREKGFLGITLARVSRQEAMDGEPLGASEDLTRLVAVTADRPLENPAALRRLSLRIDGIATPLDLDGGRQHYAGGILTVTRESIPGPETDSGPVSTDFLAPAPFIESDHASIQAVVKKIVRPEDRPLARVRAIMAWIHENIEKRPVLSVPSALATLENRMGDCNEHAVLAAALARAAGVPARIEAGLVHLRGKFYYHAWNSFHLGRWVTADTLMNQLPADVTHIRFVQGAPERQIDLMQVIGKIRFSILEPLDD